MPLFGATVPSFAPEEPRAMMRRGVRWVLVGIGLVVMLAGVPLALLFHTPGVIVLAVGLVIVLRNSFGARRIFIRAQRRHPKIVFPIRRLMRREPEVMAVAWQASLRTERLIFPRRLRALRRVRRMLRKRRR
jgi:hypothetical protein